MRSKRLGRWVAGMAVLAVVGFGAVSGGSVYQTQDIDWTAPVIQTVAR